MPPFFSDFYVVIITYLKLLGLVALTTLKVVGPSTWSYWWQKVNEFTGISQNIACFLTSFLRLLYRE
uniref:Uncharacterized protein n=1 Tax=Trichobilharzia regenti TaxID=157069 RepID=A0AA85K0N6_TRIRE|nr:unnamed protein product [Trichobilharzia regenti]